MASKKTVSKLEITDIEAADKALEEMAELERKISIINVELNEAIDQARARSIEMSAPVKTRYTQLEVALKSFALLRKAELFKGKKTLDLTFGVLSFRTSSGLVTAGRGVTWGQVLERLKECGYDEAIRIKEEVNKEVIESWSADKQEEVGTKMKTIEEIKVQTKQQKPGTNRAA